MISLDGLLSLLDARSFGSLWYWLVLALVWSAATRGVLGVPPDVILRARRAPPDREPSPEALLLLDWLSLTLPRLRVSSGEAAVLLGLSSFGLTVLVLLGFGYGYELAQAAALILLPLVPLAVLRLRLAHWGEALLARARRGEVPAALAAAQAARAMTRHRWIATGLSLISVGGTAAWGARWRMMHPNGL